MDILESIKGRFVETKAFIERNERRISSVALIAGFIIDSLTLRRVDLLAENFAFVLYIFLACLGIIIFNLIESGRISKERFKTLHAISLIVLQFAFGGLASGFLVFYSRSANFGASWPFLLILLSYLIGNEVFKKKYLRLWFQMGVFFLTLNSYLIFLLPVITGKTGDLIFIISGIIALILITLFVFAIARIIPIAVERNKKSIFKIVGSIFIIIQILYFTNLIPPIPLALKDSGIYHSVIRLSDGNYELVGESNTKRFLSFLFPQETIHYVVGESIHAWSSVFAPTRLNTNIIHFWQKYDESRDAWRTEDKIVLPISGGRAGGYRTYSTKTGITPGKWRVDVKTPRGQLIGRINFIAEEVGVVPSQVIYLR